MHRSMVGSSRPVGHRDLETGSSEDESSFSEPTDTASLRRALALGVDLYPKAQPRLLGDSS